MDNVISMKKETLTNITFNDVYEKIIKTFPIYYKVFKKYIEEGKNVEYELNRLYEPIFSGLLEYYYKFMEEQVIMDILTDITIKYNPDKSFTIIDYLEYLYGNILYETFLSEIKKINKNNIRYEHLCLFEYIIIVECVKYSQYINTINIIRMTEKESKLLIAMEHRKSKCLKKISFCLSFIERNYSNHENFIELCWNIVKERKLENFIDLNSLKNLNSFMNWNK